MLRLDTDQTGVLDEAYERLHRTGREFAGFLANHGPMAAEARLGDWPDHFQSQVTDHDWRIVLAEWWPTLLPGSLASATHSLIRVGHSVRALNAVETPPRVAELGQALGYWATLFQPVPGCPAGRATHRNRGARGAAPRPRSDRWRLDADQPVGAHVGLDPGHRGPAAAWRSPRTRQRMPGSRPWTTATSTSTSSPRPRCGQSGAALSPAAPRRPTHCRSSQETAERLSMKDFPRSRGHCDNCVLA
jgi:hypothetical protein